MFSMPPYFHITLGLELLGKEILHGYFQVQNTLLSVDISNSYHLLLAGL